VDLPLGLVADRMVWSSKRLNVFGADSDEEGGIISTDTECFGRDVGGGGGERVDVEEEAMLGEVVGWARTKAAEVDGGSAFTAAIREDSVCSGFGTAGPTFEDTVATVAMCRSCKRSRRVCDQE
jgi:hypothetical protein